MEILITAGLCLGALAMIVIIGAIFIWLDSLPYPWGMIILIVAVVIIVLGGLALLFG